VRLVRVRLGDASGVEPELFRTAFDGTRDERGHGDATLEVVAEPEAWRCAECARPIPRGAVLQCPACGAAAQLVGGDALFLDHLELEVPTGAPAPPGTRR
jgi:hydrogenase nickel incorporation protein HypA/HybF